MLQTNSQGYRLFGSREVDFLGFNNLWSWWPSWSCDIDTPNKLIFPLPIEAPYNNYAISIGDL